MVGHLAPAVALTRLHARQAGRLHTRLLKDAPAGLCGQERGFEGSRRRGELSRQPELRLLGELLSCRGFFKNCDSTY